MARATKGDVETPSDSGLGHLTLSETIFVGFDSLDKGSFLFRNDLGIVVEQTFWATDKFDFSVVAVYNKNILGWSYHK